MYWEGAGQEMAGIIIAVSDPHIRYLMQRYAEEYGFQSIDTPGDGSVADLARRIRPQYIVLEVDSPGAAEPPALRQLRADPTTCDIPVIAYISGPVEDADPGAGYRVCLHDALMYGDFVAAVGRCAIGDGAITDGASAAGGALPQGDS